MDLSYANEAQLRAIAIRLRLLDEAICEVEQFVHGREIRSIFVVETNTLAPSQRKALAAGISAIRDILDQFRADFHFIVSPRDAAGIVRGECNGQWLPLTEMQSRYLRGYGEVAKELAEYLDPKADELLRRLRLMAAICGESWQATAPCDEAKK
jgi:hypothetical protein